MPRTKKWKRAAAASRRAKDPVSRAFAALEQPRKPRQKLPDRPADVMRDKDGVLTWTARFDGSCLHCPRPIVAGVDVITRTPLGDYIHRDCY